MVDSAESYLLLEQILKRLPRIAGPLAGRCGRFLFPRHADFKQRAIVSRVLLGNPFLDRLHALESAARIEIHALLAGVQFETTLRTLPACRQSLQHRAALCAARHGTSAWHIHRARSKCIVSFWRGAARPPTRFVPIVVAILITRLAIFRHRHLPKQRGEYCVPNSAERQVRAWPTGLFRSPIANH